MQRWSSARRGLQVGVAVGALVGGPALAQNQFGFETPADADCEAELGRVEWIVHLWPLSHRSWWEATIPWLVSPKMVNFGVLQPIR